MFVTQNSEDMWCQWLSICQSKWKNVNTDPGPDPDNGPTLSLPWDLDTNLQLDLDLTLTDLDFVPDPDLYSDLDLDFDSDLDMDLDADWLRPGLGSGPRRQSGSGFTRTDKDSNHIKVWTQTRLRPELRVRNPPERCPRIPSRLGSISRLGTGPGLQPGLMWTPTCTISRALLFGIFHLFFLSGIPAVKI